MSYMHIENLYKEQTILLFRECFALEKIHGTSTSVYWREGYLGFFSGGESAFRFVSLFDHEALKARFMRLGHPVVKVYGEAYGGSQQGQTWRYGDALRFIAFEVQIGDMWLAVPQAEDVVMKLGLEFVYYNKVSTDLAALDAERDTPSVQAKRNGVAGDQPKEGIVLRPLVEFRTNNGERVIAKHKRDEERETKTPRAVVDPARLTVLMRAQEIADEWVTPRRLEHVLDKLGPAGSFSIENTREVISAMIEDVLREGDGELVNNKEVRTAISKKAAALFIRHVRTLGSEESR